MQNFINDEPKLDIDRLSAADWIHLTQMRDFLKSFYEVTKLCEGREATIDTVVPIPDFLLHKYDDETLNQIGNTHMEEALESGRKKLQKY